MHQKCKYPNNVEKKITEADVSINGACGTICVADELTTAVHVLKKRKFNLLKKINKKSKIEAKAVLSNNRCLNNLKSYQKFTTNFAKKFYYRYDIVARYFLCEKQNDVYLYPTNKTRITRTSE